MPHATGGSKTILVPESGDDGWQNPVAGGALAVFDASNPAALLETSGIVTFSSGAINEEIPNSGGLRGFRFRYPARPDPTGDGNNERRYTINTPQGRTFEHIKMWQPSNYEHRHFFVAWTDDTVSTWQVGDSVTGAAGITGTVFWITDLGTERRIHLSSNTGSDFTMLPDGGTLTNTTRSNAIVISRAGFEPSNNKFSAQWVDDGGPSQGYSNGGMIVEASNAWDTTPNSKIKADVNTSNSHGNSSSNPNEISNNSRLIDIFDNGSVVEYIIERSRSSAAGVSDGVYRIWKKTTKSGSAYLTWTLIYQNTALEVFDTFQDNKFSNGYLYGYANSGFTQQTDFHLMRWELWNSKPQVLINAGV